jgi:hypothetical protein
MKYICEVCKGCPCILDDSMDKYKLEKPSVCLFYPFIKPKWNINKK